MGKNYNVLPPGAKVYLMVGEAPATVTAVQLREDGVRYEVAYWHNGERKTAWLTEAEVESKARRKHVGFRTLKEAEEDE